MKQKPEETSGLFKVASSIVITMNLEFSTLCAKRRIIPYSTENIDVIRATNTNQDVLGEKRVDDYWNVDVNRSLSDSWKGFTKFTLFKEKPPKGFVWSR